MKTVGIVVNPLSGTDLRRMVAAGSMVTYGEKVNMLVRILRALAALGVERVRISPDHGNLAQRAIGIAGSELGTMDAAPLELPWLVHTRLDTERVVARMCELGFGCIVVLGGDGTCRAVASVCGDVPLIPVSTGTNNAFPRMLEGTLVGVVAAATVAGVFDAPGDVVCRAPCLALHADGECVSRALVDIAVVDGLDPGTGAVWDGSTVRELFLAQTRPDSIGLSAIGAGLYPLEPGCGRALHVRLGREGEDCAVSVMAAMAPGMVRRFGINQASVFEVGTAMPVSSTAGVFAFDGEREIMVDSGRSWSVSVDANGPWVVDAAKALAVAAASGFMRAPRGPAALGAAAAAMSDWTPRRLQSSPVQV